jgi:hypothetical protein
MRLDDRLFVIFKTVPEEGVFGSIFILPIEILGQGFDRVRSSQQWENGSGMKLFPRVGRPVPRRYA